MKNALSLVHSCIEPFSNLRALGDPFCCLAASRSFGLCLFRISTLCLGPVQLSRRDEQDGTDDRNQHPHSVCFGKDGMIILVILTLVIVILTLVILSIGQDRKNQSAGYQGSHLANAVVKSEHRIFIGVIWPK